MVNKKQLKKQLLKLRNELKDVKGLVKDLENKNGEYKEELYKAKADYAEVCCQYQKTRGELLKAEGRINEANEAERIAVEQLNKAQKLLAKRDKELAKANENLDNANKENALLEQKIVELDEQLAKAKEKGNEVDEIIRNIYYQINGIEKAIDILDDEVEELGTSATEKCAAVDEFNEIIKKSSNQTVINAQKHAKSIALDDKADIERTINTKRNMIQAKSRKLKELKITLNTISEFRENDLL